MSINNGTINGFAINDTDSRPPIFLSATDGITIDEWLIADHGLLVADSLNAIDSSSIEIAWAVREVITAVSAAVSSTEFTMLVAASTTLQGTLKYVVDLTIQDSLDITGGATETINRLVTIADTVRASGEVASQLEANVFVAAAAAMASASQYAWDVAATDSAGIVADVTPAFELLVAAMSAVNIGSTLSPGLSIVTSAIDSVAVVSDEASNFISFIESLEDVITFGGVLTLPDGTHYNAWVSNLHTGAPFKYTNYPFNSFAVVGERQFGCTEDGLFELVGDTDSGVSIDAVVRSGLIDFGTAFVKNMEAAYLGYSSDGSLYLKVIDSDGGDKRTVVYQLDQTNNAVAENRLELGRGAKARYWQFEVSNIDGADFLVDTLDVLPVILNRRR